MKRGAYIRLRVVVVGALTSFCLGRTIPMLAGGDALSSTQNIPMAGSEPLVDRLDNYDLGKNVGLTGGQEVSASVVQSVILAADKGNRDSLYFLGLLKLYGISVSPDLAKARECIKKAAELRHLDAMFALGVILFHGKGGSRDYRAATAWFKLAVSLGHTEAMWFLGRMYYEGKGVDAVDFETANEVRASISSRISKIPKAFRPYFATYVGSLITRKSVVHEYGLGVTKDQRRAAEWHSLAAGQGLADSHYHLGLMKAHGRGFSQDLTGAAIHFQKGAKSHHAPCMLHLGKMFLYGKGFPVDYDMALLWFEKAAEEARKGFTTKV